MAKRHWPRFGSMAYYPRKRAKTIAPNFENIPIATDKETKILNFTGFKAGMVHFIGTNINKKSTTFNQKFSMSATVIEVPPMKAIGYRIYTMDGTVKKALTEVREKKAKKEGKTKGKEKKEAEKKEKGPAKEKEIKAEDICDVKVIVLTQPKLAGLPRKKGRELELSISGTPEKQLEFAKGIMGKEVKASEVFEQKEFIDIRAVTKGKGLQGPAKRFGIKLHRPKDKYRRTVGSIGPWNPSTVMFTVARAGQMGFHTRTELNKKIIKMGNGKEINPKGGFKHYGLVESDYIMVKGSVAGPPKREIALRHSIRPLRHDTIKLEEAEKIVL